MTKQLLIYGNVRPVNKINHADLSVKTGLNYDFARHVNSVPLTAVEFQGASQEYPIVFAGNDDKIVPVVVLGIKESENVYVDKHGKMLANYIPAFLRRYPFVFSSSDDGNNFTLCIDEDFSGCHTDGRGERLFDSEGEKSQYLENVLTFLQEYQAHFSRTEQFCKKLQELNLLEPMGAQVKLDGGQHLRVSGFQAINREKLKMLSGDQLATLVSTDELELIYIHLQSLSNFNTLSKLSSSFQDTVSEKSSSDNNTPEPKEAKQALPADEGSRESV